MALTKLEWFKFSPSDFSRRMSIRLRYTLAETGCYILLACSQWDDGFIPDDTEELANICGTTEDEFLSAWAKVSKQFPLCADGLRRNEWIESLRTEADAERVKTSAIKSKAAHARWHNEPNLDAGAMQVHAGAMQNMQTDAEHAEKRRVENSREKKTISSPSAPGMESDFDEFWGLYPRRPNDPKAEAKKKYLKARERATKKEIHDGAAAYREFESHRTGDERKFIAMASTWLHNSRWDAVNESEDDDYDDGRNVKSAAQMRAEWEERNGW